MMYCEWADCYYIWIIVGLVIVTIAYKIATRGERKNG